MDPYQIDVAACRRRQQRLVERMAQLGVELAIVTRHEHVQWLAGPFFSRLTEPAAALGGDGRLILVAAEPAPEAAAADKVVTYQAKWHSTIRNDQRQASSEALLKALGPAARCQRLGVEFSAFCPHLAAAFDAQLVDLDPVLLQLRRRKEPDELARIRKAIAATGRMYERARQIIRPGISELEVFNQLQAAAVLELGEMLTGTGNDYQCASRGGPPRAGRTAQAGELYILDLGPAFRGYFADNCRTIAVSDISSQQQQAWEELVAVLRHVESTARPGVRAAELFDDARAMLGQSPLGTFDHHLGHGIGLFPHEGPHLNPHWDDVLQPGDVFTVEPGLYSPELRAGIRLENNYLVTENGVELLTDFPLELQL